MKLTNQNQLSQNALVTAKKPAVAGASLAALLHF